MNPLDEYGKQLTRWLLWTLLALLFAIILTLFELSGH
jgi:hypothetical protein